jgi:Tol biopolymer transport system component
MRALTTLGAGGHFEKEHGMRSRTTIAAAFGLALATLLGAPTTASADGPHGHRQGRIVFGAETPNGTQLWTIRPNGTHLRQITHVDGDAVNPDWSPNGRRLTFEWDTPDRGRVAVMDADGDRLRTLPPSGCAQGQPVFTADARRIIYERFDCRTDDSLFAQRVQGGHERRVTTAPPDGHTDPNVSPDGRHLSFIRVDDGVEFHQALTVAKLDGTHQHDLLPPSWDIAIKHAWSPDSRRLVFTRDADPDPVTGVLAANVGTVRADGRHVRMLTHYTGGRLSAFAGSYSPDGRHIVFRLQDNTSGKSALWVMRTDGSHRRQIFSRDGVRPRFIDWG